VGARLRREQGLGKGCARRWRAEGVNLVITARGCEALQATAAELRALAPASRCGRWRATSPPKGRGRRWRRAAGRHPGQQRGGPPPGDFRDWDRDAWISALDANMLTPIELIKATVDAMAARLRPHRQHHLGAVKAPIDTLGCPTARAAA
jgi:3-oxoacyl-[acyl-carrier protein] reductase